MNYAKLIGALLIAAGLFFAGWSVNGWRWEAKYTDRENILQAQYSKDLAAYAKKLSDQEEENRRTIEEYEGKQASLQTSIDKLKEQAKHAHFNAPPSGGSCDHPFTTDLPRTLNRLSSAASGEVPADPAPAPDTGGAASAPAPTSDVTGNTLVEWYADVARAYGTCRERLDAIRAWDAKP